MKFPCSNITEVSLTANRLCESAGPDAALVSGR